MNKTNQTDALWSDNKMNQVKPQVINGFMLAAGFGVEKPARKAKAEIKIKPAKTPADKKARDHHRFLVATRNIDIQKKVVQGVIDGLVTVDQSHIQFKGELTKSYVRKYFRRLSADGYLDKTRVNNATAYIYSVTDEGLAFIGGSDEKL